MPRSNFVQTLKSYTGKGDHWLWLNAGAIALSLVMVLAVILFIAFKGLAHFWPSPIVSIDYVDKQNQQRQVMGEIFERDKNKETGEEEWLVKTGNRDSYGLDFVWLKRSQIKTIKFPKESIVIERREWGVAIGQLASFNTPKGIINADLAVLEEETNRVSEIYEQIRAIQAGEINAINHRLEQIRLEQKRLQINNALTPEDNKAFASEKAALIARYQTSAEKLDTLYQTLSGTTLNLTIAGEQTLTIPTEEIIDFYLPNEMAWWEKLIHFFTMMARFVSEDPREANTEGGVFPSIFGTVMMVFLMTVIVTPLGVITAVYLHEYAKQGWFIRLVRISVNNLAGVPSIVYGVFGLGFFVYFLGGNIDALFYPEALPAPTFGTPGLLWAALTMALLTLPVVIVATEEGLARIPRSLREGSLALGATKFETLWHVILPMSSPAMMTGLILAIARAAGEVAPLMLVGVVKLAPSLPLDGNAPFFHLERKFMHLGFHIYDVGFQSPNVEAARPLVYATALLLILIIVLLNLFAIKIRNDLRDRYKTLES